MARFSANLGYLWQEHSLHDAIRAAKTAGFDAVECHAPYAVRHQDIASALADTGLCMLGINTRRGGENEFGLAAIPDRQDDARKCIAEALAYARSISAESVHVLTGNAQGPHARDALLRNLELGAKDAGDITLLIEPLNIHDAPGYFLNTTEQARAIIEDLGAKNVKLLFDCYHVTRTEGDVIARLSELLPIIGHIQFAGVPDRGPPDQGTVDYRAVFAHLDRLGWTRPLGAEYRPPDTTEASLGWMETLR